MARIVTLALTMAALVAGPAAAQAPATAAVYPGQHPARSAALYAMLDAADAYWDRQGMPAPCAHTALDVASDLTGGMTGWTIRARSFSPLFGYADCRIVLSTTTVRDTLADVRGRGRDRFKRRYAAARLCTTVAHEAGHIRLGAVHTEHGLMAAGGMWRWGGMPSECRRLSDELLPQRFRLFRDGFGRL